MKAPRKLPRRPNRKGSNWWWLRSRIGNGPRCFSSCWPSWPHRSFSHPTQAGEPSDVEFLASPGRNVEAYIPKVSAIWAPVIRSERRPAIAVTRSLRTCPGWWRAWTSGRRVSPPLRRRGRPATWRRSVPSRPRLRSSLPPPPLPRTRRHKSMRPFGHVRSSSNGRPSGISTVPTVGLGGQTPHETSPEDAESGVNVHRQTHS